MNARRAVLDSALVRGEGFGVQCPSCGADLIPGKKFCHACGAHAAAACPQCGATLDPTFRFCPDCGARIVQEEADAGLSVVRGSNVQASVGTTAEGDRLQRLATQVPDELAQKILASKGSVAGERKVVTVLCCDLVGSTAIAERLDPEEYHDLLAEYLEIAIGEIYALEGIVNQLAGDGVMALFGAPIAHEDAPQRAVQAAMAIRSALADLSTRLQAKRGFELRARFGINTGPVVVGTVGNDLKMDYTAIGDTTNLAEQLQAMAGPGNILLSETTYRRVRGLFELQSAEAVQVAGKDEPVAAYRVVGMADAPMPMAVAAARGLTPLVGRGAELAQLQGCYQRLTGQLAQVVALVGEAGSGKSRLLYEFKRTIADDDTVLLEARCSSLSQGVPYAPWLSMLRQYFDLSAGEPAASACTKVAEKVRPLDPQLTRLYPYLCHLLSIPVEGLADLSADEMKRATFEAMARLVGRLSMQRPVVMIIEDLHWIDDASREMLELAATRLLGRVMLIVSHRPDYLPFWRTQAAFTQLRLRPLPDHHTKAIIRAVAGGRLPTDLGELIRVKAEGNPFFAEEITRALLEEGQVIGNGDELRLARPLEEIRIPGTVEEIIAARVDRFGSDAKRVSRVAAVLGRQFRRDHLVRLLDGEDIDVGAALEELERRGVIHRKSMLSGDEYRFGESLTQEVAYQALLLKERRQLHERIGRLLEAEGGADDGELAALLAHHFGRGDDRGKAMEALLRAAQRAERLPSYASAVRFYREAWELAEAALADASAPDVPLQRWAVTAAIGLCRMAVVHGATNEVESERAARRGRELADALGDVESIGALSTFHGMIIMNGKGERFAEGLSLVEQGVTLAQQAGLSLAALNMSRGLAWSYLFDGRFELANRTFTTVVSELERADDRTRLSDLYLGSRFMRDLCWYFSDDLPGALAGATETHQLARQGSNRTVQSGAAATVALVHFARADYTAARGWADAALQIAEQIGNVAAIRTAAIIALGARVAQGEPVVAGRYFGLIEQGFIARGDMALKSLLAVEVFLMVGEPRRARAFAEIALQHAGGRLRSALCAAAMGEVLHQLGPDRWDEAARYYQEAIGLAQALGARAPLAAAYVGAGELAAARGEQAASAEYAKHALALCRAAVLGRYQGRAERLAASLMAGVERSA